MGASLETQIQQKHNLFNARTDFSKILEGITPNGGTSLRDAICVGIKKILEINKAIPRDNPDLDFHFIHIILTDGQDTNSKIDMVQLGLLMRLVGVKVDKKAITNHFIGIDLSQEVEKQLRVLSMLGEDTSQFHLSTSADTGKIFDRIQASIEVQQKVSVAAVKSELGTGLVVQNKKEVNIKLKIKRFIVVFNLDISGSMSGSRWRQVRKAVANFVFAFKENDLFSIILFNDSIREVIPTKDQMFGGDRRKPFDKLKLERQQEAKKKEQKEAEEEERLRKLREAEEEKRRKKLESKGICSIF